MSSNQPPTNPQGELEHLVASAGEIEKLPKYEPATNSQPWGNREVSEQQALRNELEDKFVDIQLNCLGKRWETLTPYQRIVIASTTDELLNVFQSEIDRVREEAYDKGHSDAVMEAIQARNADGETKHWFS